MVLVIVLEGLKGSEDLRGPVLKEGCLSILVMLYMLGILGICALAGVLVLDLICLVTCSKLAICKAIITEVAYIVFLFGVFSEHFE